MKSSYHRMASAISFLLLAACVDNRNDFSGASASAEESTNSTLPPPENLSATAIGSEVNLSWDAVEGATAYKVYIYDESGYIQSNYLPANLSAANTGGSTVVSVNSHQISSLEYETDYYFNVTAVAGDLESEESNEVGVRPLQNLNNSTPSVQLLDINVNAAEMVTLSAEVSDPDGNGVSYLWRQTSGDSVNISDSDQPESYFTAPIADTPMDLGFALTVSDDYGASNSNTAIVTVSDNFAPQVDAGADQSVSPGAMVNLLGSASDSDGSIVEITWQLSSGSDVILSSTSALASSFVAPSSNSELTLVFQLSVSDDRGASASDTVMVTVAADQEPTIDSAINTSVPENTSGVIYTVSATSSADEVLSYDFFGADIADFTIDLGNGTIGFTNPPDYENPADSDGDNVYQLSFEVSDSVNTLSQALSIDVTDLDEFDVTAPEDDDSAANAIAENSASNTLVGITAKASDADGTNNTITYSFADGANSSGLFDINATTGVVSYNGSGGLDYESGTASYSLNIKANSSDGSSASASFTVNIIDVNEAPVFASTSAAISIAENNTNAFYTASASDEDTGASVTYSLASGGADNDLFAINAASGELQFKAAPDYETYLDSDSDGIYQVRISASDGSLSAEADLELAISITDVNEAPIFTTNPDTASASENSIEAFYTALADDEDYGDTVTYSLPSDVADNALFNLNAISGDLQFKAAPDYEVYLDSDSDGVYQVIISASDGGLNAEADLELFVGVTDVNEAPIIDSTTSASIPENTSGTIYTTEATDPENDTLTYDLYGTDQDDFIINPSSGAIAFVNTPDHETPTDADSNNVYKVTLEVSDGNGNSASQALAISVTGVNEYPVSTPIDADGATNQIAENAAAETPVGITVSASDADGTNNTVSYGFTNGNQTGDDNLFSVVPGSGIVKLLNNSNSLDYETATSHDIVIEATSSDGSSATQTFTIAVIDVDEFNVIFATEPDADGSPNQIAEDADPGTVVGITAAASDADGSATVSYSFTNDNQTSSDNLFSIASDTGIVTLAAGASLDYETATSHDIAVKATSSDGSTDTETFTVAVTDIDEFDVTTPTDSDSDTNQIAENASSGATVGITASASDGDGTNNTVSYSFTNDSQTSADNLFSIASDTGIVTLAAGASLDYETATSHELAIKATSSDGSTDSETFTVAVTDVDEFDVTTPTDSDSDANQITENASSGATVGITASASDGDGTNNTVSYSFDNDLLTSGFFSIDASSGVVTLTNSNSLDYETGTSHDIIIKSSSSDGSTDSETFTVAVTDVDEFDVSSPTDSDSDANQIAENASSGATVGITASASDGDGTNNTVSYSFDNDLLTSGFFSIDASSGVVTLTNSNSLDYETGTSHDIVIKAISTDGSTATSSTLIISVIDHDEFDVSTPTDSDSDANQITENASSGATVGITASASDGDGTNNTISYSFDNDSQTSDDNLFSIASDTGIVTLTNSNSLDYEAATSHDIVIKATSIDGSAATSSTLTINVIDHDEFDVSPPTDSDSDANQIAENASSGATVGITASASDGDGTNNTVSYSFANDSQTSGFFSIDASSGVVTLTNSNSLDYEIATSHDIIIKSSSSDGSTDSETFTVAVTDVDEFDVSTPTDSDSDANQIAENASSGATVGITATASDGDGTNSTVSYSFDNDLLTSSFFSIDASSGVVTLTNSNSLDYETATNHQLVVKAASSDGSTATATFTINVTDVNEHDVVFATEPDADSSPNQIAEDAAAGTAVGITATASDADDTAIVSYGFTNGNQTSDDNLFSIDPNSGIVKLLYSNSLDYETATSHDIAVKATSSDGSSTTRTFTIDVTDVNDNTPIITPSQSFDIDEASANGTSLGTVAFSDADSEAVNTFTWGITGGNTNSAFAINSDTGEVTVNTSSELDTETTPSYSLSITVSDGATTSSAETVTINVNDLNDNAPVITASQSFSVDENSANATSVGTVMVTDADTTATTYQDWTITGGNTNNAFAINDSTGELSVADASQLDYESGAILYTLSLTVSDGATTSSAETVTININDLNDNLPIIAASQSFSVDENSANATSVGTVMATDADATATTYQDWTITGGNTNNAFAINDSTGELTVNTSSELDTETTPSYTLTLTVSDGVNTSSAETVTISINDLNDNTPIITPSQSFDIDEASANGTSLGTVVATDADATATTYQDWSITGGNTNNAFAIDPSTGELTVNTSSELDYESGTILYTLSLTVSDGATTSAAEAITINILDVSEHDAAPSAAYLGLPDNYINITFTPESGVSYQLHRSFVEGCTSSSCDAEGYQLFASPNSSGTADTMTFSQTHYYSLVGDNSTTFTTSINDSDGAKLAALVAAQSLSTEYDLANDWVNISATDSNNVTYTLYMAGEPFAAGGCEDSELDNIGSLCADGSSLSDGSMHSATEVINWSARRYYRLDISDGYQVVHSLESNASVIDPVVLNASNASLTIDITWSALNSAKLAEYTVYLSDDSAATTASAATWSSLSNPQIISGNSSELYSLVPILSQYYVAITATNTENETTPLSKVYLVNNIVTGDPDPSTWHEIIADTDDSPAHWEGRSTHASLVYQDKMWLIGGRTASEHHIAEVWSSTDGYNWTEVNPSAAFGARKEFVSMVHDGKMWVLGGEIEGNLLTNDVWYSSDGANWHEATPAASWHVRDYFGGVAFASGATGSDEMWVLGHYTGDPRAIPGIEDHHYSTDGSTWSSVSVSGLPPSSFFPAITFNNAILIVGGYFYTNSAWSNSNSIYSSADGVNWTELSVSGSIWDARRVHTTLVYDDKLWVLAGDSGYNRDDYWYSSDGTQWHEVMASGSKWEARKVHTSVNYAGRMWMLGGEGSSGDRQLNDVWASGLEITSFSFQEVLSNSL